jgi:hypothetical protein
MPHNIKKGNLMKENKAYKLNKEKQPAEEKGKYLYYFYNDQKIDCIAVDENQWEKLVALDTEMYNNERRHDSHSANLSDDIQYSVDNNVEIIEKQDLTTFLSYLSDLDRLIYKYFLDGYTQFEISKKIGKSQSYIAKRLLTINKTIETSKLKENDLSDDEIMGYLSKVLFMDGETAKILCDRGFSRYLGVTMGEDLALKSKINYDLANREIIREKYICSGEGRNMPSPYMFSISWGKMLEMKVENPACEIITDLVNFKQEVVNTGMIIFENELGGTMFVMSMTVEDVHSHSLLNYRRQRLFQRLITKTCDELVYAKEAARIYLIQNEAKDEQQSGFKGQLTLINLSGDTCKNLELHLPNDWKNREYLILNEKADWEKLSYEATKEGIILKTPLNFQDPVYILCK